MHRLHAAVSLARKRSQLWSYSRSIEDFGFEQEVLFLPDSFYEYSHYAADRYYLLMYKGRSATQRVTGIDLFAPKSSTQPNPMCFIVICRFLEPVTSRSYGQSWYQHRQQPARHCCEALLLLPRLVTHSEAAQASSSESRSPSSRPH